MEGNRHSVCLVPAVRVGQPHTRLHIQLKTLNAVFFFFIFLSTFRSRVSAASHSVGDRPQTQRATRAGTAPQSNQLSSGQKKGQSATKDPARPARRVRSAPTYSDSENLAGRCHSSTRSRDGAVAMATKGLEGDLSRGRLNNRKTVCGRHKLCGRAGRRKPFMATC